MSRIAAAAALAAALLCAPAAGGAAPSSPSPPESVLVTLRDSPGAAASARRAGARLLWRPLALWRVPARSLAGLRRRGLVRSWEAEQPRRPLDHLAAGDELLPTEWWLQRVGADRVEPPGPGLPLTVLDSGIDLTHPEFVARPATELLNEQTIDTPSEFHGTAVSSVAAAPSDGRGLVGAYPRARLLSWDADRDGRGLTSGDVVDGLFAAAGRGRGIINISLGGPYSQIEAQAVATAFANGVIVVAAAGNDGERGSPPSYPASLPHVVTVAATDEDDAAAPFSNRARAQDVAAPGVGIPIALPLSQAPEGYSAANGTSFSAPIVAAALAWAWTVRPELDKTQLVEVLRRSARDLPPAGRDTATGFGLLDIPALLTAPAPPRDPFEPNDDVDQVTDDRHIPRSGLTTQGRRRTRVLARLDVADDPRDVYPLWIPARHTARATLTNSAASMRLLKQPREARGLTAGRTERSGVETLTVANSAARGRWAYVSVFLPPAAQPTHTTYTLAVTTARARR